MFRELMPLIQNRPLTITVASVSDLQIRVNVVPQVVENDKKANSQIGHSHSKEVAPIPEKAIKGLTTPLCLTGTPEEIDAELASTLTNFTSLHAGLQQSFKSAAAAIGASVKAIDERERIKKEKDKGNGKKPATPKAEEKKPADEGALPLLWTTQSQSVPAAVSANDATAKSTAVEPGPAASTPNALAIAQTGSGDEQDDIEEDGAGHAYNEDEVEEEDEPR
jgi:PRTRC genetic system protein E